MKTLLLLPAAEWRPVWYRVPPMLMLMLVLMLVIRAGAGAGAGANVDAALHSSDARAATAPPPAAGHA